MNENKDAEIIAESGKITLENDKILNESNGYEGWHKMHIYAFHNKHELLLEMLNSGVEPDIKSDNLLSYGDYVNYWKFDKNKPKVFKNVTPLYIASQLGNEKCVEYLMKRGANPKNVVKLLSSDKETNVGTPLENALLFYNFKSYKLMRTIKAKSEQLLKETYNSL